MRSPSGTVWYRPRAREDLVEVWSYIAQDNETAADRFLDLIGQTLQMLCDNPFAGRLRPELGEDMRSFPVGNYVLFYRPATKGIELVRAINGYRDIQAEDMADELGGA